jgi:arrestin-related trafficking adapter 4/5/7
MNVRSIKIKLLGKWRVVWFVEPAVSTLQIRDKGTMVEEELVLYPTDGASSSTAHKIAPGTHEWRFKFTLDSTLPESVEGLPGSYIVYDLTAEMDRGYMSKNLVATKHVRVVRTLGRDITDTVPLPYVSAFVGAGKLASMVLTELQSNEDTWREKLWYNIYLPTRYYIYGTSVTAEFTLCPLHKGVTIGKIKMEILERVTLSTEQGRFKMRQTDNVVATHEQEMPENSLHPLSEETTGIADESYHFKVTLPLERSLNRMRQSVETEHIKVWHNLKIYVNLHNPDGHVSQLLVRNLLHIFISPDLPIGDDQTMAANPAQLAQAAESHDGAQDAPPTYGRHQLDQLYDEIDTGAFLSGVNTPFGRLSLSRHASDENLRNLLESSAPVSDGTDASDLQSRLAALQSHSGPSRHGSRENSPPHPRSIDDDFHHPSRNNSTQTQDTISTSVPTSSRASSLRHFVSSRNHSRPTSQGYFPPQSGMQSVLPNGVSSALPIAEEYDMEALARIPSYNTAVRTPLEVSPGQEGLPTYDTVISTPSSPTQNAALQPPPRAHTRTSSDSGSSLNTLTDLRGSRGSSQETLGTGTGTVRPQQAHRESLHLHRH